jgi:hypothetical protein
LGDFYTNSSGHPVRDGRTKGEMIGGSVTRSGESLLLGEKGPKTYICINLFLEHFLINFLIYFYLLKITR